MKCSDLDELLSAYANDELSRTQREFIEEHLSNCTDCRAALVDYTEVRQRLMSLKEVQTMPDSRNSIMTKIRATKHAPSKLIERIGVGRFIPRQLNRKTGLIGILAFAIIVSLAVTIPPLFRQGDKALAAEIALNSAQVQAALGGEEPLDVTVTSIIDDEGSMRVIIRVEPGIWVIADVDMGNRELITVKVQQPSTITEQDVIDIALTDSRVQELFDKRYHLEDLEFVEVYSAIVDVWTEEYLGWTGVNPEDLIGLTAGFSLQLGDTHSSSNPKYTVVVNVNTGKVVWIVEPGQGSDVTIITTVITTVETDQGIVETTTTPTTTTRPLPTTTTTTPLPTTPPISGYPKGMENLRWLTDAEKDRVIEIALNTPEALGLLETETYYEASVRWVAINWLNGPTTLYGFDYEDVDVGVPENVPESAELYSQVEIYIAGAIYYPKYLLRVAINPDTGKVAHVEWHGLKIIPTPE